LSLLSRVLDHEAHVSHESSLWRLPISYLQRKLMKQKGMVMKNHG
jgi:hypothetical protein